MNVQKGQSKADFIAAYLSDAELTKQIPDKAARYLKAAEEWQKQTADLIYKQGTPVMDFKVVKVADQNLVSGWANVSFQTNGVPPLDWDDDIILPDTLEKAAINFMMDYRTSGVMHQGEPVGIIVESIVLTHAKQAAMGIPEGCVPQGWFITVKVLDDEVFSLVKSGAFRMFSIQGNATRMEL